MVTKPCLILIGEQALKLTKVLSSLTFLFISNLSQASDRLKLRVPEETIEKFIEASQKNDIETLDALIKEATQNSLKEKAKRIAAAKSRFQEKKKERELKKELKQLVKD